MPDSDSWLERAAALRPDRVALEAADVALTYAELLERARAARRFEPRRACGPRGDALGRFRGGAARLHARQGGRDAGRPRLGERERAALRSSASGAPQREGALVIVHTSGTTGAPRP
jgi:acyl-CoA synthetase (AMP-forming)/AMP-acid ligase II